MAFLFSTGSFEQTQLDGFLDYLDEVPPAKDAIFLDVGGNIGVYSILLRDHFSEIYTFEPNPVTFSILKANLVLANVANAKPVNLALSNQSGEIPIYVPQNGNLGWATLNADHHTVPVAQTLINSIRLDAFVADSGIDPRQIGLIKIDVEGHEKNVIDGAAKTLANSGIPLLFEVLNDVSGAQLIDALEKLGYQQFDVFRRSFKLPFATTFARKKVGPFTDNQNSSCPGTLIKCCKDDQALTDIVPVQQLSKNIQCVIKQRIAPPISWRRNTQLRCKFYASGVSCANARTSSNINVTPSE